MAEAVDRRPLNAECQVRFPVTPCGFFDEIPLGEVYSDYFGFHL